MAAVMADSGRAVRALRAARHRPSAAPSGPPPLSPAPSSSPSVHTLTSALLFITWPVDTPFLAVPPLPLRRLRCGCLDRATLLCVCVLGYQGSCILRGLSLQL